MFGLEGAEAISLFCRLNVPKINDLLKEIYKPFEAKATQNNRDSRDPDNEHATDPSSKNYESINSIIEEVVNVG